MVFSMPQVSKRSTPIDFAPGIGQAVAERTILRKKPDGSLETWADVAERVSLGNSLLCQEHEDADSERMELRYHMENGSILLSGRHLQHGDITQKGRNQEVFTNCATSCNTFSMFYLLLNGSGVGRCYDDDMMLVDWDNAPNIHCVISHEHPDFDYSAHESVRDGEHKYGRHCDHVYWHKVGDSREGWTKALEIYENMAFEKIHRDSTLILDFSDVRCKGSPIKGMQDRPASGPVPLINSFKKASTIKRSGMPRWKQALYIDHYFAECVLFGGARRSARMSTKTWRDPGVFEFITVKTPIEYRGMTAEQVRNYKKENGPPSAFLWSSNNSVTVDAEFWSLVKIESPQSELERHAHRVFELTCKSSYNDGTGEPGLINVDKFSNNTTGLDKVKKYVKSDKYSPDGETHIYLSKLLKSAKRKRYSMITNPCGEIELFICSGFCVIGDCAPYFAKDLNDAEDAFRTMTRALIRVNSMDSIYSEEVRRTNRIGVGITGIHEYAWKFFGYGFYDLIDEKKSRDFWMSLSRFKRAVRNEAVVYSKKLGINTPMTDTTIKPAGTTSKLHSLTEGWHLPAMEAYLRWVQFNTDSPLVKKYRESGYPILELKTYQNTVVVGFPTKPLLTTLGIGDKLVTATQATPEEQYQWIKLGEKYWIRGVDESGVPLTNDTGNQISYTLKYDPTQVSFDEFKRTVKEWQPLIKCCSVMPTEDTSSYEYLPEESITKAKYEEISARIRDAMPEDVDRVHVDCASGACPTNFVK